MPGNRLAAIGLRAKEISNVVCHSRQMLGTAHERAIVIPLLMSPADYARRRCTPPLANYLIRL